MRSRYDPVKRQWDFEDTTSGDFIFPALTMFLIIAALLSVGGLLLALIGLL